MELSKHAAGRLLKLALAGLGLSGMTAQGAVFDWKSNATTTAWGTPTNWVGNAAPGSTDIARFNQTSYSNAPNAGTTTIAGLIFGDGSTSTAALTLSGTNLTIGSSTGITINANAGAVTLSPTTVTLGASQTWTNNAGTLFTVNSNISNGGNTLTLAGSGNTTISGVLGNGAGGLTMNGAGTLTLSNVANTYTGNTTLNNGTLVLAFSQSSLSSIINSSSVLVLGGGTLTANGAKSTASVQTFASTTLAAGDSAITTTVSNGSGPSMTVNLNVITRNAGGMMDISGAGTVTTKTANTASTILGGWATVGGNNWAVSAGNGTTSGAITALGSYTNDTWASGNNTTVTQASNTASALTTNSLRFNSSTTSTITLSGANTITSGGILVTSNVGAHPLTITGGTSLTSGNGSDLIIIQNDTNGSGGLTIASKITGSIGLTKSGAGVLTLSNTANNYSGTTYVNNGTLKLSASSGNNNIPNSSKILLANSTTLDVTGITSGFQLQNLQTLAGFGTVTGAATILSGGTVSPGDAGTIGSLSTGNFTFNSGSHFAVDLGDGISDLLAVTGTATLGGSLDVTIDSPLTASSYTILTDTTRSGTFSQANGVAFNAAGRGLTTDGTKTFHVTYNSGSVVIDNILSPATIGTITATPVNVIAGVNAGITFTVQNSGVGTDSLYFSASPVSSTITGSASGTVSPNTTSSGITGLTFNSATTGTGQTATFTVSDPNSSNGSATGTLTANVYTHANGVLTVTSPSTVNAIAGQVITPTYTFTNSGSTNDSLKIISASNLSGSGLAANTVYTAGNGPSSITVASITAPAAGSNTSKSYSITWLEDQTVIGATAGNQTTPTSTVTVNAFSHANGVLTLSGPATIYALSGQVFTPTFTFTNSGSTNDSLKIIGASNLSGSGLAANTVYTAGNGPLSITAASITAGSPGGSTNLNYSVTWLEDQTVVGATAGNQSSSTMVTVNSYSAATLSVSPSEPGPLGDGSSLLYTNSATSTSAGAKATTITTTQGLNGTWSESGLILNSTVVNYGSPVTASISFNKSNLLNGATSSGSITTAFTNAAPDGSSLLGSVVGDVGSYTWNLQATVSGNVAPIDRSGGRSTFGTTQTADIAGGGSFAGLTSTVNAAAAGGGNRQVLGTTAAILGGVNSSLTTPVLVGMEWRARLSSEQFAQPDNDVPTLVSDVVNVSVPTSGTTFVMQMTYDSTTAAAANMQELGLQLGSFNGTQWVAATSLNSGNNATSTQKQFLGSFAAFQAIYGVNLANYIGAYGVDTTTKTAWAVVNHDGQYAVVPEPASLTLLGLGAAALLTRRKRRA